MVHRKDLERVRRLHIPRGSSLICVTSFPCLTVRTLTDVALYTPVQASPVEPRPDTLVRPPYSLVPPFHARVVVMENVLLQGLRDHQLGDRLAIRILRQVGRAEEQQTRLVDLVLVCQTSSEL